MAERDRHGDEPFSHRERREALPPFHRAARFVAEQPAIRAYQQAQDALYAAPQADLSVYRLLLNQIAHVVVLGQTPPRRLQQRLDQILATGDSADLPQDVLQALTERRHQQSQIAPWVERHHRPGRRL